VVKLKTPVSDEHLKALGQVIVNFALLETHVAMLTWALIGKNQRVGQIITAGLSFRSLLTLTSSLWKHQVSDPERTAEFEALLEDAQEAEQRRNVLTHSLWGAGESPGTVTRVKATAKPRKGLRHQFQQMSVKELNDIADFISEVAAKSLYFTLRMVDQGVLPNIPFERPKA
jgi:hypothetical protein